jgi:hypothetical protein
MTGPVTLKFDGMTGMDNDKGVDQMGDKIIGTPVVFG